MFGIFRLSINFLSKIPQKKLVVDVVDFRYV